MRTWSRAVDAYRRVGHRKQAHVALRAVRRRAARVAVGRAGQAFSGLGRSILSRRTGPACCSGVGGHRPRRTGNTALGSREVGPALADSHGRVDAHTPDAHAEGQA
eukprot:1779346-Rhodomonas_salina.1